MAGAPGIVYRLRVALSSTRMEYRIALQNVDAGVELAETVIIGRHPSETAEHLTLRVLAYCVLHEERLELGPGLSTPDAADLWTHDLTGRLTTWVECGAAYAEKLRKVVQHNAGARIEVVLADARRGAELLGEIRDWRHRPEHLRIWIIDEALVEALAAHEERRHRWTVTLVGGHLYMDADGVSLDGALTILAP